MVGQLSVSGIGWGSLCSANVGYWVSEHVAGRGITPTAVALATDHCLLTLGLHRMEVNIRPENAASLRVVDEAGLPRRGAAAGLPAHRRGLAGPPDVRASPARSSGPAACSGTGTVHPGD